MIMTFIVLAGTTLRLDIAIATLMTTDMAYISIILRFIQPDDSIIT